MRYIQRTKRAETIKTLREELSELTTAPLHERMRGAYAYHTAHPELSARILCEALSIDQGTYRYFVKKGASGNKCHSAHRQEILRHIHEIQEATPNATVPETVRQLKAQGCKCSHELVTDIMEEAGSVTCFYSIAGIMQFLEKEHVSDKLLAVQKEQAIQQRELINCTVCLTETTEQL